MPACVELRLPNRPEFVAIARLTVAGVASRMSFDIESIEDMKVAVSEACTNAIQHGCPAATDELTPITLCCELHDDELIITVHDSGDGFDPATATRVRPGGNTATLTERGLGMLLIESLMDEVTYSCNPGDGTQVRMVKRLRADAVEER